jgi:hypothetical protein
MLVVIAIVFMMLLGGLCFCTGRTVLAAATELLHDEASQHRRN